MNISTSKPADNSHLLSSSSESDWKDEITKLDEELPIEKWNEIWTALFETACQKKDLLFAEEIFRKRKRDLSYLEKSYSDQLLEAKNHGRIEEQIFCLIGLSDLFIEKKKLPKAACYLNGALAIIGDRLPHFQAFLYDKLEKVEELFFVKHDILFTHRLDIEKRRLSLQHLRRDLEKQPAETPVFDNLQKWSLSFKTFFASLIISVQESLGTPPVKEWAWIAMGSMAREEEMCPYSDIEFFCLIKRFTPQIRSYFRKVVELLEIQVINLGETKYCAFGEQFPSPNPGGFSFDSGGNTPRSNSFLIGTPRAIARFQKEEAVENNIILSNALTTVSLIQGHSRLLEEYQKEKREILEQKSPSGLSLRQSLALKLLKDDLVEYRPNLTNDKEKVKAFGVKQELYRPIQAGINCLSLFFGVEENSTRKKIDRLVAKNVLNRKGATNLKKALSLALQIRLQAHLFYRRENELLYHKEEGKQLESGLLYFNSELTEMVRQIYQVLIPFSEALKDFLKTLDSTTLNQQSFFSETIDMFDPQYGQSLEEAHRACQHAVSLNPGNIQAQVDLAHVSLQLGDMENSLGRALQALQLSEQNGDRNYLYSISCEAMGDALIGLKKYEEALPFFEKIILAYPTSNTHQQNIIMNAFVKIAESLFYLENYLVALDYYEKAKKIILQTYRENNYRLMNIASGMGLVCEKIQPKEALSHFENVLQLKKHVIVDFSNREAIAQAMERAGDFFCRIGKDQQALLYYREILTGSLQGHPRMARIYLRLAQMQRKTANYEEVLQYQTMALEVYLKVNNSHPLTFQIYYEMAETLLELKRFDEAIVHYSKCAIIVKEILENKVFSVFHELPTLKEVERLVSQIQVFLGHPNVTNKQKEELSLIILILTFSIGMLDICKGLGDFVRELKPPVNTITRIAVMESIELIGKKQDRYFSDMDLVANGAKQFLSLRPQNTADSSVNIAPLLILCKNSLEFGKLKEATSYSKRLLKLAASTSTPPLEKMSIYEMHGDVLASQGRFWEVGDFFLQSFNVLKETLEPDCKVAMLLMTPEELQLPVTDSSFLYSLEKIGETVNRPAIKIMSLLLPTKLQTHDGAIWRILGKICRNYMMEGELERALNQYEELLDHYQKQFDFPTPFLITCLTEKGIALERLNQIEEARACHEKAVAFAENVDCKNFYDQLTVYRTFVAMGDFYAKEKKFELAISYYERVHTSALHHHPLIGWVYFQTSVIFKAKEENQKAFEYQQKALNAYLACYPETHPFVIRLYGEISQSKMLLMDRKEGVKNYKKAIDLWTKMGSDYFHGIENAHKITPAILDFFVSMKSFLAQYGVTETEKLDETIKFMQILNR